MPRLKPKHSRAVLTQEQAELQRFIIRDFSAIERIATRNLTPIERGSLTKVARAYLFARTVEIKSPAVAAVIGRLDQISKAAGALKAALTTPDPNHTEFLAGQLLGEHLEDRISKRISGQIDAMALALLMADVQRACKATIRSSLEREPNSPAWARLVQDLRVWAKAVGLSPAVSKRLEGKDGALQLSPFLGIVKALQDQFPEEYRQHAHSDGALAKAITDVRDVKLSKS